MLVVGDDAAVVDVAVGAAVLDDELHAASATATSAMRTMRTRTDQPAAAADSANPS